MGHPRPEARRMQGVSTTWNHPIEAVGSLSRPTRLRNGIVAVIDGGGADYVLPRCEYQTSARNLQARNCIRQSIRVKRGERLSQVLRTSQSGRGRKTLCGNRVPLDWGPQLLSRTSDKEMGKCICVKE
jgi:hypothetical protein